MHSRVFNIVPKVAAYEKIDENDAFEMMENRVDYVTEIIEPKAVTYEMDYLLKVLKVDLPNTELSKDFEGKYILRLSMKDVKDKLTRFDKNLNDRYGYLFLFELNLPFTELEWFYYMLTKYAPDAVVEFVVLQVYDYHF